jgi:hypothetical protein
MGEVDKVLVTGAYAKGLDNPVIDLIFVGNIDRAYLTHLVEKVENLIHRKIRYIIYQTEEFQINVSVKEQDACLLLWIRE